MKAPAFQFYPKQWLGDDKVMAMSWDARAMHMHLICIAWQQDPPCTLPDDDAMIKRWLGNPRGWESLKAQIFAAWKMVDGRWVQNGLLEQFGRQAAYRESRKKGADARWGNNAYASSSECIDDALQSTSSTTSTTFSEEPIEPLPENAPNSPKKKVETVAQQEEAIYEAYPRKVGRGKALQAIRRAVERLSHETPHNRAMKPVEARRWLWKRSAEYANSWQGRQPAAGEDFRPHPATWFNQERYFDDTQEWNRNTTGEGNVNRHHTKPTLAETQSAHLQDYLSNFAPNREPNSRGDLALGAGDREGAGLFNAGDLGSKPEPVHGGAVDVGILPGRK